MELVEIILGFWILMAGLFTFYFDYEERKLAELRQRKGGK